MKLNQFSQNEVETIGEAVDTEFSIDTESLGVLFKGFSDALYSDKFGSIVREITSNCFDAHEEVNQKLDVQVRMVEPNFDEGKIIFEDLGPGLSPDRIKNIYSKYFASTKRNTNDQIGGFGIGAKSPLAYADSFNVVTRVNGTEYDYIIHKGEQVPVISLVATTTTDKINGTQVIIPIANTVDYRYFLTAVKDQLRYFDNITYKIPGEDINNDYKIFRGKHWIHTTNGTANDRIQLCIGKVGYPLDWKAAGFEDIYYHEQSGNFALYFDVGEISVTMNRESVEYNTKTRAAIKAKVAAFREEAKVLSEKNNRTADLQTYYNISRENSSRLRVNDECILHSGYFFERVESVYEPLEDLGDIPNEPMFFINVHKSLGFTDKASPRILKGQPLCRLLFNKEDRYNSASRHLKGAKIFRVRDRMNAMKDAYIQETYGKFVAVKLDADYNERIAKFYSKIPTNPNYEAAQVYFKHMIGEVVKHTDSYDGLVVPQDWIDSYKLSRKRGRVIRSVEVIPYKSIYLNSDEDTLFSQEQNKVSKILQFKGTVVYGNSKQREKLCDAFNLMYYGAKRGRINDDTWYCRRLKEINFIMISDQRKKYFKGHYNAIDVDQFVSRFYGKISRIYNYHMIMDIPPMLSTDSTFELVAKRLRRIPDIVLKEFEKTFKFAYEPESQYITLPYRGQTSVLDFNEHLISWKSAHPLHEFVRGNVDSNSEEVKAIKHYINLINFNTKIKSYV